MRGKIKAGTMCGCDFCYFIWPDIPDRRKQPNFNPNMTFNFELNKNGTITAWADNYGGGINKRPGNYGNGQIHLSARHPK